MNNKILKILLLFISILFITGCNNEETDNPFDDDPIIKDKTIQILVDNVLEPEKTYDLAYSSENFNNDVTFKWSTNDEEIAKIEDEKLITVIPGEFTLTITASSGEKESKKITISDYPQYKVTYILNPDNKVEIKYDKTTLPLVFYEPTLEGATFEGWYLESDFSGERIDRLEAGTCEDLVFYAKWNYDTYNITYFTDGGSEDNLVYTHKPALGSTKLNPSQKIGYKFIGWVDIDDPEEKVFNELSSNIKRDILLVAKWEIQTYKIIYHISDTVIEEVEYNYFSNDITLMTPTSDKVFVGWFLNSDCNGERQYIIKNGSTGDIDLYAKWKEFIYTVEEVFNKFIPLEITETLNLPDVFEEFDLLWTTSNEKLLSNSGVLDKAYLLHKYQTITIFLAIGGSKYSANVNVAPIVFDDLPVSVASAYVASGSLSNYTSNNPRYIKDKTLFSKNTIDVLDIIYYCFVDPNNDGTLSISDNFKAYLSRVLSLRNNNVRIVVSINGATSGNVKNFSDICSSSINMDNFIKNLIKLVNEYHFDGIDIDWEFPGVGTGRDTAVDRNNMTTFVNKLRKALDEDCDEKSSKYLLTAAIPSTSWGSERYDFRGMNASLDYVNMMSYDLNNEQKASHLCPLYSSTLDGGYKFSADYGVKRFTELGLSKEKIVIGAAAYGKLYKVATNLLNPLGTSATLTSTNVTGSFSTGTIYYNGIMKLVQNGKFEKMYDDTASAYYLYNATDGLFITYDSSEAIKAKCEYAKENGIGIMFWSYGEDATDTIINAICQNMK